MRVIRAPNSPVSPGYSQSNLAGTPNSPVSPAYSQSNLAGAIALLGDADILGGTTGSPGYDGYPLINGPIRQATASRSLRVRPIRQV